TITDEEVYQILRSGITGGLSQVMHRYNRYEFRTAQVHQIHGRPFRYEQDALYLW
ncbi:MAG: hypothetical protein EZS28_046256, partial [Streblomastix strix]